MARVPRSFRNFRRENTKLRIEVGAVSIEWEDNDAEQHAGAKAALANVHRADLPPSGMRHDEMLRA